MAHSIFFSLLLGMISPEAQPAPQQMVYFDACALASGLQLHSCQVGYRTFGRLAADKSNVLVLPTWLSGQSKDWAMFIGPGKLIDPSTYFVVVIDALGNGISSSPSNHPQKPGTSFPALTTLDMVTSSRRLLVEHLGITHVRGIIGISMGGMLALLWGAAFPDDADKIVSMVGTPRPSGRDRRLWRLVWAPKDITPPLATFNRHNRQVQIQAMLQHDIAPGRSLQEAAALFHARLLLIVGSHDWLIDPQPSLLLAAGLRDTPLILPGLCGHFAPVLCDQEVTQARLQTFLNEP